LQIITGAAAQLLPLGVPKARVDIDTSTGRDHAELIRSVPILAIRDTCILVDAHARHNALLTDRLARRFWVGTASSIEFWVFFTDATDGFVAPLFKKRTKFIKSRRVDLTLCDTGSGCALR